MRCENCGNQYHGSLECPLCGHRALKVSRCNVCQKIIYYGQEKCPNCGSPTRYLNKENINSHYYGDFNVETQVEKNKKNTSTIKKRKRAVKKIKSNHNQRLVFKIFACFIGLAIASSLISTLFESFSDTIYFGDTLDSELEDININGENSPLIQVGNYYQNGNVFMQGDDVYLGNNFLLRKASKELNINEEYPDLGSMNIYVEDNSIYYDEYGEYYCFNVDDGSSHLLFKHSQMLPIGKHRFLYCNIEDNCLYLFENGVSTKLCNQVIDGFTYDFQTELVYGIDEKGLFSLDNQGLILEYFPDIVAIDDIYVENGVIYYSDYYDGINRYNPETMEIENLLMEDVEHFILVNNGIIYLRSDNELCYCEGDATYTISENVSEFNVLGDKVVYVLDDGTYENWYLSNYYGQMISFDSIY